MKDRSVFGFAGLWETWTDKASGEVVRSCTVITTEPNKLCAPIHNRMPVILDPADYAKWLGERAASNSALQAMLGPFPAKHGLLAIDMRDHLDRNSSYSVECNGTWAAPRPRGNVQVPTEPVSIRRYMRSS